MPNVEEKFGGGLLSHTPVCSTIGDEGLDTSEFGMGSGISHSQPPRVFEELANFAKLFLRFYQSLAFAISPLLLRVCELKQMPAVN